MKMKYAQCRLWLLTWLILQCAVLDLLPVRAQSNDVQPASSTATNAEFEPFITDPVHAITLHDATLYWNTGCGGVETPVDSRVKSVPTGGGLTRTLFYRNTDCERLGVASRNVAVDDLYIYWLTYDGQLVRLPRGATTATTPETLDPTAPGVVTGSIIAVSASHIFWSTEGSLFALPKTGGARQVLVSGSDRITDLHVSPGDDRPYYLAGGFLRRVAVTDPAHPVDTVSTQVTAFTVDNEAIYWAERLPASSTMRIMTASLPGLTGATLYSTIDGTGNPQVTVIVVDVANLYWQEVRSSASGPIVRLALTNRGGTAETLISSIYSLSSQSLVSDGRYLFAATGSGIGRVSTRAAAVTTDIVATGLEVIQAIQSPANDVPLVLGKETFVRLYGRFASSDGRTSLQPWPPAALIGRDAAGQPLPGSPLTPINGATVSLLNRPPERTNLAEGYLFRLPASWSNQLALRLTGVLNPSHATREASGSVEPYANNRVGEVVRSLTRQKPLCLDVRPVATIRGPSIAAFDPSDPGQQRFFERAKTLLPTANVTPIFRGGPPLRRPRWYLVESDPFDLTTRSDAEWLIFWMNVDNLFGSNLCSSSGGDTVRVAMLQDFSGRPVNGMAFGNSLLFFTFGLPAGSFVQNVPGGGVTLAHELAHIYGRDHVNCPTGVQSGIDTNYPYGTCMLDNLPPGGTATVHIGFDASSGQLLLPFQTGDLMSAAHTLRTPQPRWTSDYTWHGLFNRLHLPFTAATTGVNAASQNAAVSLIATGIRSGNQAELRDAYQLSGPLLENALNQLTEKTFASKDYKLVAYDAANTILGETPLQVMALVDDSAGETALAFFTRIDLPDLPSRLAVVRTVDNQAIGATQAGVNPPAVVVTAPSVDQTVADTLTVQWEASDPDGDLLHYVVRYSHDNGVTWTALGSGLTETTLTVAMQGLPGGTQALVQIIASDGLHSTVATSPIFTVARHTPQAAIYNDLANDQPSADAIHAQQGAVVALRGRGYDADDGPLSGAALQWHVVGPATRTGDGEQFTLADLPPGSYTLTLTVTDSDGSSASDQATLFIAPKTVSDGEKPTLDGLCDDAGYGSDTDPIILRSRDEVLTEVRMVHAGSNLYACFSGLPIGTSNESFAGLRVDRDNSGGNAPTADDLGFFVGMDSVAFVVQGDGNDFVTLPVATGLAAAVSQSDATIWNAELRITEAALGGWNKLTKMKISHYWRDGIGDDTVWPTDALYNVPATWGWVELGVTRAPQLITFDPLPNVRISDAPPPLHASSSSTLPVTFSVDGASGVCTIVGNQVHLLTAGICTIVASQPGNHNYLAAAPVAQSFTVAPLETPISGNNQLFLPMVRR